MKMKKRGIAGMLILALLTVSVPGFTCRTARAEKKDGWEIKSSTELGFDSVYKYAHSKNSIVGKVNGKVAIFNTQTGEWIKTEYDGMVESYSDLCVSKKTENGAEYYIIDSEMGEVLHKLGEFDRVYPDWVTGGFHWIEAYKNSKIGLIDIDGNVLIPIEHSSMNYLQLGTEDGEEIAYFECSKDEDKTFALYTSKGTRLTDYNYKWIYYKPYTSKENQIGNCTIRGSEVISAENLTGEVGLLIDGKEIGFDKKLNDKKEGTVVIFHRIKCGMEDYAIKCFYDSEDIYDNAEHLWEDSFSRYDNAYYRSEKDLYEVLSLQQSGVAYDIYDMDGETVSLDSLLQELKKVADAEEEAEAAAEEELQNKVKAEIDKLDMDSLCTGTDYVEVSEIEIKEIRHRYGKIYVELEAKFSKSPDEDSYVDYDRNTVAVIYDENYELIAYGICLYGHPYYSCCYRDTAGKLHYFQNGYGDEDRDSVLFEDTKGEYCTATSRRRYENDLSFGIYHDNDMVKIIDNSYKKVLISDVNGEFVQECMYSNSIDLEKTRVLITASKDTALVYDSEWELIKRIDLSELNGKFDAEYYDDGLWIFADDVSKKDIKITSAGEVSKFAKSSLAERVDITVWKSWVRNDKCYSLLSGRNGGKYEYVMYCRETDEILFTVADNMYIETYEPSCVVDDEVLLSNDKSSISVGDDLYWVYREQGYYGLIDESGNVVIDGKKEGFNSRGYSSSYYGGLSSVTFEKGDERVTAAEILKTSEEGERLDPEKCGDIMYAYTGDYDTGYDEYVFDKEGNIIYKNLGIASKDWGYYYGNTLICENIKLILKVDSWWDGTSAAAPTATPTPEPTAIPTNPPAAVTTPTPTPAVTQPPENVPSSVPTAEPTLIPSVEPTAEPTVTPSVTPTAEPTLKPTVEPAEEPSAEPTAEPSTAPTVTPSKSPEVTVTPKPTANSNANKVKVKKGLQVTKKNLGAAFEVTKCGKKKEVEYVKCKNNKSTVNIPDKITIQGKSYKVTEIGRQAFNNKKKLQKVVFGKNIKKIQKKAFMGCSQLKSVSFNKELQAINAQAFCNCKSLVYIAIPSNVKSIGSKAFYGCSNLQYILVQSNKLTLDSIGKNAFGAGYHSPRVKTEEKMWRLYAVAFIARGLSENSVFVIDPVELIR